MASAVRGALPPQPIQPMPWLPLSPDQLAQWDLKASPDATEPRARRGPPDLKVHRGHRVSPAFPAPRENPDGMVLRVRPAPSVRRVLPGHPVLLAALKRAQQPRGNPGLLDLKDRPDLRAPRVPKVWRDTRVRKGLKALRGREGSWARRVLPVPADLLDLLAPSVR